MVSVAYCSVLLILKLFSVCIKTHEAFIYGDLGDEKISNVKKSDIPLLSKIDYTGEGSVFPDENKRFQKSHISLNKPDHSNKQQSDFYSNFEEQKSHEVKSIIPEPLKRNETTDLHNSLYQRNYLSDSILNTDLGMVKKRSQIMGEDLWKKPLSPQEVLALHAIKKIIAPSSAHELTNRPNKDHERINQVRSLIHRQHAISIAKALRSPTIKSFLRLNHPLFSIPLKSTRSNFINGKKSSIFSLFPQKHQFIKPKLSPVLHQFIPFKRQQTYPNPRIPLPNHALHQRTPINLIAAMQSLPDRRTSLNLIQSKQLLQKKILQRQLPQKLSLQLRQLPVRQPLQFLPHKNYPLQRQSPKRVLATHFNQPLQTHPPRRLFSQFHQLLIRKQPKQLFLSQQPPRRQIAQVLPNSRQPLRRQPPQISVSQTHQPLRVDQQSLIQQNTRIPNFKPLKNQLTNQMNNPLQYGLPFKTHSAPMIDRRLLKHGNFQVQTYPSERNNEKNLLKTQGSPINSFSEKKRLWLPYLNNSLVTPSRITEQLLKASQKYKNNSLVRDLSKTLMMYNPASNHAAISKWSGYQDNRRPDWLMSLKNAMQPAKAANTPIIGQKKQIYQGFSGIAPSLEEPGQIPWNYYHPEYLSDGRIRPPLYPISKHLRPGSCLPEKSLCDRGLHIQCCGASTFCTDYWGISKCLAHKKSSPADYHDPDTINANNNYKNFYSFWLSKLNKPVD